MRKLYYITALLQIEENGAKAKYNYTASGQYGIPAFTLVKPGKAFGPTFYTTNEEAKKEIKELAKLYDINEGDFSIETFIY